MATIDQVLDRVSVLLHRPNFSSLPLDSRLAITQHVIDDLTIELSMNRIPDIISSTTLDITGGTDEALPSDFGSVYLITTDPAQYPDEIIFEIPTTNMLDREYNELASFKTGLSAVEIRNVNTARRLVAVPEDAELTYLKIWYKPSTGGSLEMTSTVPIHESFHMTVVPVEAACRMLPYCQWDSIAPESQQARREELMQHLGTQRVSSFQNFIRLSSRLNPGGPSAQIVGFGAFRNRMRFGGQY